jgi:hypothetical protein
MGSGVLRAPRIEKAASKKLCSAGRLYFDENQLCISYNFESASGGRIWFGLLKQGKVEKRRK